MTSSLNTPKNATHGLSSQPALFREKPTAGGGPAPFSPSRRGAARAAAVRRRVAGSFSRLRPERWTPRTRYGRRVAARSPARWLARRGGGPRPRERCAAPGGACTACNVVPSEGFLPGRSPRRRPPAGRAAAARADATPSSPAGRGAAPAANDAHDAWSLARARCHGPAGGRRAPRACRAGAAPSGPRPRSVGGPAGWPGSAIATPGPGLAPRRNNTCARADARAPLLAGGRAAPCAGGPHGAPEHDGGPAAGGSGAAARRRRRS